MKDNVLHSDLENIAKECLILKNIKNCTILISGATGLIGSQLVKAILHCNTYQESNITVIALVRNQKKAELVFENYIYNKLLKIIKSDILEKIKINDDIDYIIHGASVTNSQDFIKFPVETINISINGTNNILSLAKEKKVKGFVYLSSLEVYGIPDVKINLISENDFGYLDFTDIRSSYSEGKRMAECLCFAYGKQYKVPIKIARLTQTFGAGVDYNDNRVFAQFARSVIEKKDIVLHTTGQTVRSYCYTSDAVMAILTILIKGENSKTYNVANSDTTISIKDMAIMITNRYKSSDIKILYELGNEQELGYNPMVKIRLDATRIKELGWEPKIKLEEMFDRLIESMKISKTRKAIE